MLRVLFNLKPRRTLGFSPSSSYSSGKPVQFYSPAQRFLPPQSRYFASKSAKPSSSPQPPKPASKMSTSTSSAKSQNPPTVVQFPKTFEYSLSIGLRETAVQKSLREVIEKHERAIMMSSPEESQFLALLTKILHAKKVIEVGVFMGYTTLALALALPEDGKVVALDVNEEWTSVGKKYWIEAGVNDKIHLTLAPATESLDKLIENGESGTYDLSFIDADKSNYDHYYEKSLKLLRPGGLIVVDNVLWHGHVLDPNNKTEDTLAIRALNEKIAKDPRVEISVLTIADGITICRKV